MTPSEYWKNEALRSAALARELRQMNSKTGIALLALSIVNDICVFGSVMRGGIMFLFNALVSSFMIYLLLLLRADDRRGQETILSIRDRELTKAWEFERIGQ